MKKEFWQSISSKANWPRKPPFYYRWEIIIKVQRLSNLWCMSNLHLKAWVRVWDAAESFQYAYRLDAYQYVRLICTSYQTNPQKGHTILKRHKVFCHLKDVGGSPSSASSPSPLCTGLSPEVVFNHWRLSQADLQGVGISLHHQGEGDWSFRERSCRHRSMNPAGKNVLSRSLPGKRYPSGTSCTNPSRVSSRSHYTHPWTCVLSLVAHQNVKYISFLQRKYGRYEDPVVAFVVVFGSFPSCSSIGRDPEEIIAPQGD